MANPSPDAVAAIRAQTIAPLATSTDAAVVAALNAPTVPNPKPQPLLPPTLDEGAVLSLLAGDPAAIDRLNAYAHLDHVLASLNAGDLPSVQRWFVLLTSGTTPIIAAGAAAQIRAMLSTPTPDPAWPPRIGWAQANLGRPIDTDDMAAARQGVN